MLFESVRRDMKRQRALRQLSGGLTAEQKRTARMAPSLNAEDRERGWQAQPTLKASPADEPG